MRGTGTPKDRDEVNHDSRAYRVIGEERFYELRLEMNELRHPTEGVLVTERGRERVLTPLNARLLHECLNVAHVCMNTDEKVRELMPDCFRNATRDSCYVMQQVDVYPPCQLRKTSARC